MTDPGPIHYEKYHGTGNDFLVVPDTEPVEDRIAFARQYCDRRAGPGADGVLFVDLDPTATPPRVTMDLVQPDGSRAAMCGNGARVVAVWAAEQLGVDHTELVIETGDGPRTATVRPDSVTIEMGNPTFEPAAVPVDRPTPMLEEPLEGFEITAVNTGVPHAVAFVDAVEEVDVESVAPPIRHAPVFPEGANVTFATRIDDRTFAQRTYERGVEGETKSCGTGAVAICAAATRIGIASGTAFDVRPPGGRLAITVPEAGPATLTGPVVREGSGTLAPARAER